MGPLGILRSQIYISPFVSPATAKRSGRLGLNYPTQRLSSAALKLKTESIPLRKSQILKYASSLVLINKFPSFAYENLTSFIESVCAFS